MVMALAALMMPLVVGAMAMALDGGVLYLQRRQAQSAADASALAGAYALFNGSNFSVAQAAAIAMGMHNGFTIPQANVTQPTSTQIAVQVTSSPPRFFSGLWGKGNLSVSASATAAINVSTGSTAYSNFALIVLDPSGSGSLKLSNSAEITDTNQIDAPSGIQVNSTSSSAVIASNSAHTNVPLSIVGGYTLGNSAYLSGTVTTGVAAVPDPLASLPVPSVPAPTSTPASSYSGSGSNTMQPGLYTSSVTISNSASVTMQPGLYYFQGAGLSVANSGTLMGSGVTIYIDNGGGTISFANSSSTTLSAPTSGTYQGLVYFQDRSSSASPQFGNSANVNLTGTFYAAGAVLSFSNSVDYAQYASQVIVKDLSLANSVDVNIPWSASTVAAKSNGYAYPVSLVQ